MEVAINHPALRTGLSIVSGNDIRQVGAKARKGEGRRGEEENLVCNFN